MSFQPIDRTSWSRSPWFDHYTSQPCRYSMTVEVDVTAVVASGVPFYARMLYFLACAIQKHEAFRIAYTASGTLGIYDHCHPCYTLFNPDTEHFTSIWTPFNTDWETFLAAYQTDRATYGQVDLPIAKPDAPENSFHVSMIPWETFSAFHLDLPLGQNYPLPIFTLGRYHSVANRLMMPIALQVNHAVCDGYHVGQFLSTLRTLLASI